MTGELHTGDARAERLALARLREHDLLGITDLEVRISRGVAYIQGSVPNLKQKKLAGEVTRQVDGVKEVINLLRIAPQPIRDDLSLKEHIRAALTRNPRIDDSRVSVEVVNGRVYLKGSVNTAVEKRLAEDEVWATPGVRDILNQLEILSGAGKSESEIVSEIKEGLSDCLGLDISKISVELQGSVAYLRGIVPNDYLRAAAEELVRWTPPVTDVVNELKVLCWTSPRGRSRLVTLKSPPGSRSPHMERSEMVTTGTGKPA